MREIERRLQLAGASAVNELEVPDKPVGVPQSFVAHSRLMFDLLALAWQAEITRVSTFMVAREVNNRVYSESGVNEPFHNLSHHSEVPANIERLAQLQAFHTSNTIGYFLKKLSETPDGDGTLLDHSLVLYGSGMSNSNQHDTTRCHCCWPVAHRASCRRAPYPRRARHADVEPAGRHVRQARHCGRHLRRQQCRLTL